MWMVSAGGRCTPRHRSTRRPAGNSLLTSHRFERRVVRRFTARLDLKHHRPRVTEMSNFTQKSRENKSRAETRHDLERENNRQSVLQDGESRPAAIAQRTLRESLNQSPRVRAQLRLQQNLNQSPRVAAQAKLAAALSSRQGPLLSQQPVQRTVDAEEEPLQSAAEPLQRQQKGTGVVQLYRDLGKGMVYGYGKGSGVNAPSFEFQKASATRTYDANASKVAYGVANTQVFEDAPKLRVSNNDDLAVPTAGGAEAKVFYATPQKIQESNARLHDSGAAVRLTQGAGQVKLPSGWNPFGPVLSEVRPDLTQVVNDNSECGAFAQNILGTPVQEAEIQTGVGAQQIPGLGASDPMRDTVINQALGGQSPEQIGANRSADPEIGEAFATYARQTVPPVNLLQQLIDGIWLVRDKLLKTLPYLQWGEHWAGVVAKSGPDYVTLENYNRLTSDTAMLEQAIESDDKDLKGISQDPNYSGLGQYVQSTQQYEALNNEWRLQRLARLGSKYIKYAVTFQGQFPNPPSRWYFAMYGPDTQSFHETWKDALPQGVTFRVRGSDQDLQNNLIAKLRALLPNDNYFAGAQNVLNQHVTNVQQAAGRTNIIAAYVTGEKQVCLARLDSAYAYEQGQAHDANALQQAHQAARQSVSNATGDDVKARCQTGLQNMLAT